MAKEQVQLMVEHFFNSRSNDFLKIIFDSYADDTTGTIPRCHLEQALEAVGIHLSEDELVLVCQTSDLDGSGGLKFQEFRRVVRGPQKLEEWAASLPLAALLGRCLSFKCGEDPLKEAAGLSVEECMAVTEAFRRGVGRLVWEALGDLKRCYEVRSEAEVGGSNAKFQTFKMNSGGIDDFHAGLAGRVGDPHPELGKGMMQEHCEMAGCDDVFETSNYGVRTTPRNEYEIATGKQKCPEDQMKDRVGRVVRTLQRIETLMELPMVTKASLLRNEVVALVLYTGPMFQVNLSFFRCIRHDLTSRAQVYNTMLRQYPEPVYQKFKDGHNLYATTIHVLVSGVMKLSRTQRLPSQLDLYRGLGGLMELPEGFFRPDERGCRGYMEWGFLSTTSDKAAALEYSGIKEGRPLAMLLRLKTGSADRPACIYELSQYPGEREYLYVPCSYLEPMPSGSELELVKRDEVGGQEGMVGAVEVVGVQVKANHKGLTVEELEGRKKALHIAAFRYALRDAAREMDRITVDRRLDERISRDPSRVHEQMLWIKCGGRLESLLEGMSDGDKITFTVQGFQAYILGEVEAVLERHDQLPNDAYASIDDYRCLVDEMLRTLQAPAAILALYLDDKNIPVEFIMRTGLMDGLRIYQSHLWRGVLGAGGGVGRANAALRLCQSLGLTDASPDKPDAEGLTPLMRAAADGATPRALRSLVWAGANIENRDSKNRSAIMFAAGFGHAHAVEELHRLGADVNVTSYPGFEVTPTRLAAQEGYVEVIEALGRLGADLQRPDLQGRTPLFVGAQQGHVEVVRVLHSLNADINTPNNSGQTPLDIATARGHEEMVRVLLSLNGHAA